MSNASTLSSLLTRSVIFVVLVIEKSRFSNPGPRNELRVKLPKWKTFLPPTTATGRVNTLLAVQLPALVGSQISVFPVANHCTLPAWEPVVMIDDPTEGNGPVMSGRIPPRPVKPVIDVPDEGFPATMFNGFPVCSVR